MGKQQHIKYRAVEYKRITVMPDTYMFIIYCLLLFLLPLHRLIMQLYLKSSFFIGRD